MKKTIITIVVILFWIFMLFTEHKTKVHASYKEKILSSLEEDTKSFKRLSPRLKKDENFLKKALKTNGMVLKYLDKRYRANKEWVLLAVNQNGMALEYASNMLKSDEEVVLEAVRNDGNAFEFAHPYLKKNRTYILKLFKEKILFIINNIDVTLQQDKELVETALAYDESAFKYLDTAHQQNREYLLRFLTKNGWILAYLNENFQKDKELVTIAVMDDAYVLTYADESLKKDKDFLFSLIKKDNNVIEYIDKELWEDNNFLLKALKFNASALEYASSEQKNDKELVIKAVEEDGSALEYASDTLRNDPEVVLKAIDHYSNPLKFADKELQRNRNFIIKAIKSNAFSITSIDNKLSKDKKLISMAVIQNARVVKYLPKLQKDKEFILEMIQKDINVLPYIDASLKDDKDILNAIKNFPSYYATIETLLSLCAIVLFFFALYYISIKNKKYFIFFGSAILLLIITDILNIYFAHGVFRTPYIMANKSHKFGLERTRCWVGDEENLSNLECYNMHVPEIYSDPKSQLITFPVRVFRSSEIFASKSPLIHLGGGGPGAEMNLNSSYSLLSHLDEHDDFSINQGRDFFIIDPRGAGLSKPLLTCDTYVDNFLTNMNKNLSLEESYKAVDSDYAQCIKKFKKEKVNFNGYNSVAVADDVHLLSKFVGIKKWVVFGVSYSTTYALFVAKKYPEIVERMILDSACFPDLKMDYNYHVKTMDSYNALYNYKEKIKDSNTTYDDINIKKRIWALHKKLNNYPIPIDYLDLKVDGNYFIASLLEGVYGTDIFKDLPKIIIEMEQNKTKSFLPYFETHIDFLMDRNYGDVSAMAHYCYEDKPFIDFSKIREEVKKLPSGYIKKSTILSIEANDFCKEMNISSTDKTLAEPIKTEIPTLFIHGEFDSITPLREVKAEMKNFKNSKLLTYKTSHAVLGTEAKIEQDVAQFLTDSLNNVVK